MPWIAAGATIISSLIGNRSARRQQRMQAQAMAAQQRTTERQLAIAERQAALGEEAYRNYERRFGGVLDRIGAEAALPVDPQFQRVSADVSQSFAAQRGAARRQLARFGVNPADGAYSNDEFRSRSAEALGHVAGREQARRGAAQQRFGNMLSAASVGSGQQGIAGQFFNSAASGMANAAGQYGQQANAWGQEAANTAYGTSSMFMDAFNAVRGAYNSSQSSTPASLSRTGPAWTPGSTIGGSGAGTSTWGPSWTSTRSAKTGIRPTDTAESAEIIRETPIRDWRYKDDPGTPKVGPIAEEAPPEISRDGKSVDPQNMVGTLWSGMQHLLQRLDQLERMVGAPA